MSYNLLKGKRGIIFGALNEMSIAWKVAEKPVEGRCNDHSFQYAYGSAYGGGEYIR